MDRPRPVTMPIYKSPKKSPMKRRSRKSTGRSDPANATSDNEGDPTTEDPAESVGDPATDPATAQTIVPATEEHPHRLHHVRKSQVGLTPQGPRVSDHHAAGTSGLTLQPHLGQKTEETSPQEGSTTTWKSWDDFEAAFKDRFVDLGAKRQNALRKLELLCHSGDSKLVPHMEYAVQLCTEFDPAMTEECIVQRVRRTLQKKDIRTLSAVKPTTGSTPVMARQNCALLQRREATNGRSRNQPALTRAR